jgi:hypothetical protein
MRRVAQAVGIAVLAASVPGAAQAACNGTLATKTGPTGITLQVCLDGKYSTCLRDSQRLGWAAVSAQRYCDNLKSQGRVK